MDKKHVNNDNWIEVTSFVDNDGKKEEKKSVQSSPF